MTGDVALCFWNYVLKDRTPLAVQQAGGIEPIGLLSLERDVRPGVVAVCREVQWRTRSTDRLRKVTLEIPHD